MKNIRFILTAACVGSLVSCASLAPQSADNTAVTKASTDKKKATDEVKKKTTQSAQKKVDTAKKKTTSTKKKYTPEKKKYTPKKTSTSSSTSSSKPNTVKKPVVNKPVVKKPTPPKVTTVKNASKVPGKTGFVFNPYTHNQVDVRGIPSGTKVRDPHDSNPTHIFRVP